MITFLLMSIFIMALLSLLSYLYCWHDIQRGRPHIVSLRQITNIMDRNILDLLFGPYERGYYFVMPPQKLALFNRVWRSTYRLETAADMVCLFGAYRYMTGAASQESAWWFIALAGLCQGINFAYSIWLVKRWERQIREEFDGE